jgi:hypothetical protein
VKFETLKATITTTLLNEFESAATHKNALFAGNCQAADRYIGNINADEHRPYRLTRRLRTFTFWQRGSPHLI